MPQACFLAALCCLRKHRKLPQALTIELSASYHSGSSKIDLAQGYKLDTKTHRSRFLQTINFQGATFQFPQEKVASEAIKQLADAMAQALDAPVDYPPISQSLVAGDQIAIALQADLPRPAEVVQALLAQISSMDFVIVCSSETAAQLEQLGEVNGKLMIHDPSDKNELAMLGIDDESAPVYINRTLFDADVVIPVAAAPGVNELSVDCIYPYFSGVEDRERFEERSRKSREGQARLANNQLGTFWGIQLVYGPGDEIHEVVVGELGAATYQAKQAMSQLWEVVVDPNADFVLATIEAKATCQSWEQICAAIVAADQASSSGAPILVCSEISHGPSRKIKLAFTQQFETRSSTKLGKTLKRVSDIVAERTVFLQSGLSQSKTEELGLGYVASETEIQRFVDRHPQGILLRDAHRCNLRSTVSN